GDDAPEPAAEMEVPGRRGRGRRGNQDFAGQGGDAPGGPVADRGGEADEVCRRRRQADRQDGNARRAPGGGGAPGGARGAASAKELVKLLRGDLQAEAITALGKNASKEALTALQELVKASKAEMKTRQAAVTALAGSRPGALWLLSPVGKKEIPEALVAE